MIVCCSFLSTYVSYIHKSKVVYGWTSFNVYIMEYTELINDGESINADTLDEHLQETYIDGIYEEGLGILNREDETIELNGKSVHQSETILRQSTTGAFVWRATPLFADWLERKNSKYGLLNKNQTIIELGAGTGALALLLANSVKKYIATDQKCLLKLMKRNCADLNNVKIVEFDWVEHEYSGNTDHGIIVACDTIYNDFLIPHFVNGIKSVFDSSENVRCALVCVQVRMYEVIETALRAFVAAFKTVKAYTVDKGVICYLLIP